MSDLREALEKIARGAVPLGTSSAQYARDALAAHPEPAKGYTGKPISPIEGLHDSNEDGFWGPATECRGCSMEPSPEQGIPDRFIADADCPVHGERWPATGVTEQAVEAARQAYSDACKSTWPLTAAGRFRAALEAAQPYMGVRPVAVVGEILEALDAEQGVGSHLPEYFDGLARAAQIVHKIGDVS